MATQQESYGQIANYNISPGTRANGQSSALEVDSTGNLKVNIVAGSAGNPAAGTTGSAVPSSASYTGINIGGNLVGQTGFTLGSSQAAAIAIVDGSGNQITTFGGGTQYTDANSAATHPIGTGIIFNNAGTYNFVSAAQPLPVLLSNQTYTQLGRVTLVDPNNSNPQNVVAAASMTDTLSVGNSAEELSHLYLYNGSTWDRGPGDKTNGAYVNIKSSITLTAQGAKTNNNAAPGATNVGALVGVANAAVQTWTEGDQVLESMDLSGNQRTTLGTLIAGEDLTNNRLDVAQKFSYAHIAAGQATTTVKSGAGHLHGIAFNSAATATNVTTVYDNTAGSGTVIAIPAATTATIPTFVPYDIDFTTGLTIVTGTANGSDMTISYY